MNLVNCYDEIEKMDQAISSVNTASELLSKNGTHTTEDEEFKTYLEDEIFRLQIHLSRRNLKKVSQPPSSSSFRHKCILHIQLVKSGIAADREDIVKNLTECYNILKATSNEVKTKPTDKKGSSSDLKAKRGSSPDKKNKNKDVQKSVEPQQFTIAKYSEESLQIFGELGITCLSVNPPVLDIARDCAKQCGTSLVLETRIYSEYIRSYLTIMEVRDNERERLTQRMIDTRSKAMNILEKGIDSSRRLMSHMNSHKNAMVGGDLVNLGCIMLWNVCLPLLQTNLRQKVLSSLQKIAESLHSIDSNLYELRASVHLEIAKCNIASDVLAKATVQVEQGITLDYKAEFLTNEEKQSFKMNRPLDRYIVPLKHQLDLQTSIYKLPETHQDEAFLLIQQAKSASTVELTKNLLERAILLLEILMNEKQTELNIDKTRILMELWSEVLKCAWKENRKIVSIARKACGYIIEDKTQWDIIRDRERIIDESIACFIMAESYFISLKDEALSLDLILSIEQQNQQLESNEEQIELHPNEILQIIDAQVQIINFIEKGIELGKKCNQDWIVLNGCIYLWNYHLNIFQDWKMYAPYSRMLKYCYEALIGIHEKSLETEAGYPLNAVHPHHLILLRITYAYVQSLIQQIQINGSNHKSFPTDTAADILSKYDDLYKVVYSNLYDNPYTQNNKPNGDNKSNNKPVSQEKNRSVAGFQQVIPICDKVIPIFVDAKTKQPQKDSSSSKKKQVVINEQQETDDNPSLIMLAKDIISLRARLVKLDSLASGKASAVSPLTTDPVEKVLSNLELLCVPTTPSSEREKLCVEAYGFLKQCSVYIPELCASLSEHALSVNLKDIVLDIAILCDSTLPASAFEVSRTEDKAVYDVTTRQWRWYTLNTLYCGQAIAMYIEGQDQQTRMKFQIASLMKFVVAMKFAKEKEIGYQIGDSFLKVAFPVMAIATTSVAKIYYYQSLIEPLDLLLYYSSKLVNNIDTGKNEQQQGNVAVANIFEKLYSYLFACLRENKEYNRGLEITKQGLSQLPITHHKYMWQVEIEFRSRLGISIQSSISRVGGYDKETQALVWIVLGHCSKQQEQKKNAFKQAVDILNGFPSSQVDYMIEYGIWLFQSNYPTQESIDLLMEAIDVLNTIDDSAVDYAAATAEEVKSVLSRKSKPMSMRSTTIRSRKQAISLRSKKSRFSNSNSQVRETIQDDQGPLTVSQLLQMITIYSEVSECIIMTFQVLLTFN
jgi:hypothetical protein